MTNEILICKCNSAEHQIIITHDDEDNFLYFQIHLTHYSFFKRVIKAIKYIFGYKCKYGAWDEFILNPDEIIKLQNALQLLKK